MLRKLAFILLLGSIFLSFSLLGCNAENYTLHYYRQLVYNHVSPFFPIRGIYEISAETAKLSPHYIFKYNQQNQILEIINNTPATWKSHPLTHISSYRIVFSYSNNQETRTYFNQENVPVSNIRGVLKEVHVFDATGFKTALHFYNLQDQPTESNWKIARYAWEKQKNLIIEKRYNLNGNLAPVSPYFEFLISGIKLDERGYPMEHYNLNEALEVIDNFVGIACYKDSYDQQGNHLQYAYYDQNNQPTYSNFFASGKKYYDDFGNVVREEFLDHTNNVLSSRDYNYDVNGFFVP